MSAHSPNTDRLPLHILADRAEIRSGIPTILERAGVAVDVRRLAVGDYIVDGRILVERKRLDDLAFSIMDTRLFSQFARTLHAGWHPILLLEGTSAALRRQHISRTALQGALITISLVMGVPVLRSTGPAETARLLQIVARRAVAPRRPLPHRAPPVPAARGMSSQARLLCGITGIGPTRATRLIERFGSIRGILDATRDELRAVPGMGPATVNQLLAALT